MQDEVNEKTISLCVRGAKMTAELLKAAMRKYLAEMEKKKQQLRQPLGASEKKRAPTQKQGKQTLKKLMQQGSELTNIQITDNNIKSFDRIARKYGIDYSLKRDSSVNPPRYLVFFKAKDVEVMNSAFKEYAGVSLKKTKKMSIRKKLQIAKERVAKHREREKTKQKNREESR